MVRKLCRLGRSIVEAGKTLIFLGARARKQIFGEPIYDWNNDDADLTEPVEVCHVADADTCLVRLALYSRAYPAPEAPRPIEEALDAASNDALHAAAWEFLDAGGRVRKWPSDEQGGGSEEDDEDAGTEDDEGGWKKAALRIPASPKHRPGEGAAREDSAEASAKLKISDLAQHLLMLAPNLLLEAGRQQ